MAKVTLDIVIDSKGNVTAVRTAGKDLGELEKGSKKAGDALAGLKKAAAIVGSAFAAMKTAEQVIDFVKLGAQAEATQHRFEAFAGGPKAATEYLQAFQTATDNTVDKMGAMQGAAKLLQMGLVDNADQMGLVAGIATKLGDQTMAAGDRINDFAALLANQSIPRLDNFGISSGKVRQRIDELIKSGQALDREKAFNMAVMEEGAKAMAKLGDTSDQTGTQIAKIEAAFSDAKTGAAQLVAEMLEMSGAADWLSDRLRGFPDTLFQIASLSTAAAQGFNAVQMSLMSWQGPIKAVNNGVAAFETSILKATRGAIDGVSEVDRYAHTIQETGEIARYAGTTDLPEFKYAMEDLTQAAYDWTDEEKRLEQSLVGLTDAERIVVDAVNAHVQATNELTLAHMDLYDQLMDASAAQVATAALSDLKAQLDAGNITFEQYRLAVVDTQLAFGLATMESIGMTEGVLGLNQKLADGTITADKYAEELARVTGQVNSGTSAMDNYKRALDALPREITIRIRQEVQRAEVADPTRLGGETMAEGGWSRGGLTMVGEKGMEMVMMPRGAWVYTAEETRRLLELAGKMTDVGIGPVGFPGGGGGGFGGGGGYQGGPAGIPGDENDWLMTSWRTRSGRSAEIKQGMPAGFEGGGGGGATVYVIHNHFGRDSVRSDDDIEYISDRIERNLALRGGRVWAFG